MADQETFPCQICGKRMTKDNLVPASLIRPPVAGFIMKGHPSWSREGYICTDDLNRFRMDYVREILEKEEIEYASLKETVRDDLREEDHIPRNVNIELEQKITFSDRIADKIADFAGSWTFIGVFAGMVLLWVALNTYILLSRAFDPYPYILLNLVLSVLAAVQAPVIIMSQNRQEMRDRLHAERDYQVSIHSELEIHWLHKKIDYLLREQGQKILEIQNIQMELMEEIACKKPRDQAGKT